jgi:hypothetical protein
MFGVKSQLSQPVQAHQADLFAKSSLVGLTVVELALAHWP